MNAEEFGPEDYIQVPFIIGVTFSGVDILMLNVNFAYTCFGTFSINPSLF